MRSTYFDNGLYDGLELTTIGWERSVKIAIDSQGSMYFVILRNHYQKLSEPFISSSHFNECVHLLTDLFDSKCHSDLLTPIAMKFDE